MTPAPSHQENEIKAGLITRVISWLIAVFVAIVAFWFALQIMNKLTELHAEENKEKMSRFYYSRWCAVR